jgi:transcriptional regulator of heat shock response
MTKNLLVNKNILNILKNMEAPVKKLVALLSDSKMPADIKEAWLALLAHMTPEQIDRFSAALEVKYLDEKTGAIDKKFKKNLEIAVEKYRKREKENNKNILEKIANLNKALLGADKA